MTNIILPRKRKLIASSFAAGMAIASPAMGHNGGPPITDAEVSRVVEQNRHLDLPWGTLPSDASLAMLMMSQMALATQTSNEAILRPQDVFATSVYSGNNNNNIYVTNGLDLLTHGGIVWIKDLTSYYPDHYLVNSAGYLHYPNQNYTAEDATIRLTRTANGFIAKAGYELAYGEGAQRVAWAFRQAKNFFRIVSYTGDGAAITWKNIPHDLGSVPGLIVIKQVDGNSNWLVGHKDYQYPYRLRLNTSEAGYGGVNDAGGDGYTYGTATDVVVSTGGDATSAFNLSNVNYVAYLFASHNGPNGIIKCGTFNANYNDPGYFGSFSTEWPVQYVLVKSVDTTGDWLIFDTARGFGPTYNYYPTLRANSTQPQGTGNGTAQNMSETVSFYELPGPGKYVYLAIRAPM